MRSSRPDDENLYSSSENFEIGKCKILKQSSEDQCLVVSAGVPLQECLKAVNKLQEENIKVRLIDIFSLSPIDKTELCKSLLECNRKILVVEEH